jgi:hypothetical protein
MGWQFELAPIVAAFHGGHGNGSGFASDETNADPAGG